MVKKHNVVESYILVLYCDSCGTKMLPGKYRYLECDFENKCPNCGATVVTKESYPFHSCAYDPNGIPLKISENGILEET